MWSWKTITLNKDQVYRKLNKVSRVVGEDIDSLKSQWNIKGASKSSISVSHKNYQVKCVSSQDGKFSKWLLIFQCNHEPLGSEKGQDQVRSTFQIKLDLIFSIHCKNVVSNLRIRLRNLIFNDLTFHFWMILGQKQ